MKWKHNALRHWFISYRVAKIKNVNEVAMEAGNSLDMIFKHYRELVTEKEADAWFGVTPVAVEAAKARMERERRAKVVKLCSGNHSGQSIGKCGGESADQHGLQSAFDHRNACEFSFHKSEDRQRR